MRTASFAFVFVLAISGLAAARDWADYQNIQDGFKVAFPGQPKVLQGSGDPEIPAGPGQSAACDRSVFTSIPSC